MSDRIPETDRRKFVTGVGATLAAAKAALAGELLAQSSPSSADKKSDPTIGIQIGSISFQDEGPEKVLDILQEKGGVNALFIASWTYGNGIAGRMIPDHPFPDHGV
jgi:hypothetical protein